CRRAAGRKREVPGGHQAMNSLTRFAGALTIILTTVSVASTPASAAGRTIGQIIDDATIVAEIKTKLTAEKLSNLTKIDVKSDAGGVPRGGRVDSEERRARAAQTASGVPGVKPVLNNIEIAGPSGPASTPAPPAPETAPPPPQTVPPASASTPAVPTTSPLEVTGTVASVDPASGTITLQDGRVLRTTDQTVVWQPSAVGTLKPGAQVLVRGAAPAAYQAGGVSSARNWRMATV